LKKCTKCGELKPLEQFCKRAAAKDGRRSSCNTCTSASNRQWQRANPSWREHKKIWEPVQCHECHSSFVPSLPKQVFCSYKCGYTYRNRAKQAVIDATPRRVAACLRCGKDLSLKSSHAIYCSKTCKSMDHTFKHRGKTQLKGTARRTLIFSRDGGACYICGNTVSFKEMELDHIIPVKKGGTSDSFNLAVSCRRCNRSKGAKISDVQHLKIAELTP